MRGIIEKMRATIARQTTPNLYAVVRAIGGKQTEIGVTTARALALQEIEDRCGNDACDALMNEIGLSMED